MIGLFMPKDLLERERLPVGKFFIGFMDGSQYLNVVEDFNRFCPCPRSGGPQGAVVYNCPIFTRSHSP